MSSEVSDYRRKRDPAKTPEPFDGAKKGRRGRKRKEPIFVVQRHDARRLHYDFRLERDGALASWAVPKGIPLEPGQRALAVHVEDHPLEYATFEGEIPKGQYGAGTVEVWDKGTYELVEEKRGGGLTVRLHGEKLQGLWALIPAKLDGDPKNWLLIRKRSESETGAGAGRTEYRPMMATVAEPPPPRGESWLHEVKWDGYRALCYVRGGEVKLVSRNGNDLTGRFSTVARALARAVRTPECVLDGEVCAMDEEGRASFSAMQQGKDGTPLVLYLFDVLEVEGEPLVDLPLTERRQRLEQLVDRRQSAVQISEVFDDGEALYEVAEAQNLEGVVSKRADSRYCVGRRTGDWLKIKTHGDDEFVVAGWTRGQGSRTNAFGSLVLGEYREDGGLHWVGNVGTGFNAKEIERLLRMLKPLRRDTSPLAEVPKMPRVRKGDVNWVEPELVAQVEFSQWTHDRHLRQPSYKGLREDKAPEEVVADEPEATRADEVPRAATSVTPEIRKGNRLLRLSNLDKPFWPEEGITKGDLLSYYRAVAPVLVPHLRDRPFTMRRYPDGWQGKAFFQKDAPKGMPDWIETVRIQVSTRESPPRRRWIEAPLVNDELALLWMVNMACIDLNVWYSRVDRLDRPDFVLFDLDPAADAGFPETVQVALLVKQVLDSLDLVGFPKTSGSNGMHVLVPVERRYTHDDTREFAEIVARALERTHRGLVTTAWAKSRRRGVLIDANQNGEGKTIASVYSVRPKPGAPVSAPLRWEEVRDGLDPARFTMEEVLGRVQRDGDLYADVLTTRQRLEPALRALGG
jgi:bifunctional non-homologous end joining protein LigD